MKIYRQTFTENIFSENNAKLFMCWWVAGMNSTLSIHWKLILFVHSQNSCFEKLHKHQRKTSVTYIKKRDSGVNFFLWVLLHFQNRFIIEYLWKTSVISSLLERFAFPILILQLFVDTFVYPPRSLNCFCSLLWV